MAVFWNQCWNPTETTENANLFHQQFFLELMKKKRQADFDPISQVWMIMQRMIILHHKPWLMFNSWCPLLQMYCSVHLLKCEFLFSHCCNYNIFHSVLDTTDHEMIFFFFFCHYWYSFKWNGLERGTEGFRPAGTSDAKMLPLSTPKYQPWQLLSTIITLNI